MATPLQLGFTDYEQTYAKKKTRRQRFLDEMEATVPWESFLALIQPVYYKPTAKGGRPPFPLEVMLRIHLLQQWFTLSDPLMEEMLIDTPCFRRFAGMRWMPFTGQFQPLTSLTPDGRNRVWTQYRPHGEFSLSGSCAVLHCSTSTESWPG
jgi:hypothetical protein